MNLLNKAQADALFQREAVLIGRNDAVPMFRAVELFGSDVAMWAKIEGTPGTAWNFLGDIIYFTLSGFRDAVSYYNLQQLEKAQRTAEARQSPTADTQ